MRTGTKYGTKGCRIWHVMPAASYEQRAQIQEEGMIKDHQLLTDSLWLAGFGYAHAADKRLNKLLVAQQQDMGIKGF